MKKKLLFIIIGVLVLIGAFMFYQKKMSATKVALINYPDFMLTKMEKSNDNRWVKIKSFKPDNLPDLKSYDQLLVFGMGLELPATEEAKIAAASEEGVNVFMQLATNPRLEQLTNMKGDALDKINEYMANGGTKNYKNLFNYIRRDIDGKTMFTDTVTPPMDMPREAIFYKDDDAIFKTVEEFETYTKKNNIHKADAPRIVLFTSMPGPFNANRDHLIQLIEELERRGINVYPIAAFAGRIDYLKEIKPNLIIYLPHGKLAHGNEMKKLLSKQNVPVLSPISVFQQYDEWLKDKQGMFGGILSQSVTMPELDGGIVPYALFAQYKDDNGHLLFKAIPERLPKFGQMVENYMSLKTKSNKDKKVAIVYFKGPGKNALVASNMEVLPSLHKMLLRMQKEGYNLGNLPQDYESFEKDVYRQGPVLGPYAEGAYDEFLKNGNPELIPVDNYNQWCSQALPEELIKDVEEKYGKAPGAYMGVSKDNEEYLAVARVQFGNVVLLPQPLPARGDNSFQLIHGAKVAPPHAYIAPYLWIQNGFKADATIHFGTHGSLEFLPGKQIALSGYDWTDPLIGIIPHYYVYTISNVGEGMIAKRRSYAVTQTYLTPPIMEAQALNEQTALHQKIHKYEQLTGAVKQEYAMSIKKMAVEQKLHRDLGLDSILSEPYSEEEMMKLSNYLEEIDHEKITSGLYTMGVPYSEEKLDETVLMMYVSALAYNLAEIDIQKGVYTRERMKDKLFFNRKYTHPSESYINKVLLKGVNPQAVFSQIVQAKDKERADKWKDSQGNTGRVNARMFMGRGKPGKHKNDSLATDEDKKNLKDLIIKIMPHPEKVEYIKKIESDKEYDRIISFLDPKKRSQAKRIAKMIPPMAKALKISGDPDVYQMIKLIQKPELRTLAIAYLNDDNLKEEIAEEKKRQEQALVDKALSDDFYQWINAKNDNIKYVGIDNYKRVLDFYTENNEKLLPLLKADTREKAKTLAAFITNDFVNVKKRIETQINRLETKEMIFASAVLDVEKILNNLMPKRKELKESPEREFVSIINSLNGGYTLPTPGGDPVTSPATVPTGRNLNAVVAEKTPSKESWKVAKKLTNSLIEDFRSKHDNAYPEKVSFTLWSSSFVQTEGTTIGQILYFLGVEPVFDTFGRVSDVRVIPMEELKRPRIDVVVQTSGQFRDLAASRLFLINKAIALVAGLDENADNNFVGKGVSDAEESLINKGFSPKRARELAKKRVFGGVNGNYGASIMGLVERGDRWDSTSVVAEKYINNMGAVYGDEEDWGEFDAGVFEAALLNTEAVVQPRQSNTWGALSLDHVYEFMGGLNLAINHVTGNDAESYFSDFRNPSNPRVQGLKEAIWVESRTTLFNPRYIKELTEGGASSAESFAETFRNTYGWNVMKPSVVENRLWDELYDVYVEDKHDLNLHSFFKKENPYALEEMTAVMLETARKGMWKATPEQIKNLANLHATLVEEFDAGCSGFVCDNMKLKRFIGEQLNDDLREKYDKTINDVRQAPKSSDKSAVVLKKENEEKVSSSSSAPSFLKNRTIWISIGVVILLILITIALLKRRNR